MAVVKPDGELRIKNAVAFGGASLDFVGAAIAVGDKGHHHLGTAGAVADQIFVFIGSPVVEQHPGDRLQNAGLACSIFAANCVRAGLKAKPPLAMRLKIFERNREDLHISLFLSPPSRTVVPQEYR